MTYFFRYYVYRYFNKRHSVLERKIVLLVVSIAILGLGLPSSFKKDLKSEVFEGEFKLVFRRIAFLSQFGFLKRSLISDLFFDFSIGLSCESAKDMYHYVKEKKSSYGDLFLYELTLAQLSSAVMESQVKPGECIDVNELCFSGFDQYFEDHIGNAKEMMTDETKDVISKKEKKLFDIKPETKERFKVFKMFKVNLMERHGLQVLRDVLSLRQKLGVNIFVISGTFLGLHREAGFLAHDYDIDLGVFEIECNNRLLSEFNQLDDFIDVKLDYPCFREVEANSVKYYKTATPALVKLYHNSGVQVDIFTHFEQGDVYWHGSSLHRWDNLKFDLIERKFLGMTVLAPLQADRYLTENYGDWRTPVKKFNCSTGTPNIAVSNSCKTRCYFLKREYFANLH